MTLAKAVRAALKHAPDRATCAAQVGKYPGSGPSVHIAWGKLRDLWDALEKAERQP